MKLSRAAAEIIIFRLFADGNTDQLDQDILKNGFMVLGDALRRCNYIASVEGIIVSHIVRKNLKEILPEGPILTGINILIVTFEMLVNLIDDFVGIQLNFMGF